MFFLKIFAQATQDNYAFVVKKREKDSSLFDRIACYKAPDLTNVPLKFGCSQFRTYHEKNYDKDWENKLYQREMEEYLLQKRNKSSRINIRKIN